MRFFSPAEYQARIDRTQARMRGAGLDALVVSDPANMNYLTGYDATSFYVPQAVVVPASGDPVWVGRGMDEGSAHATTYLEPEDIVGYDDHLVESDTAHPMHAVAKVILDRDLGPRIGVEFDADAFTARAYHELRAAMPAAELENARRLVNWVRAVKSDSEIEYLREACRVAESAMAAGIEAVRPGVRECDVAAEILRAATSGTAEHGGEALAVSPWAIPGSKAAAPHAQWSDKRYSDDGCVFIGVGGSRARYHAALCRTIYLGRPPKEFERVVDAARAGFEAALQAIKPGNTCEDVSAAFHEVVRKRGYAKGPRIGYPLGIAYPPRWNELTMSLRMGDRTPLEPNMTFHLLAGLGYGDKEPDAPVWPVDVTETVRVTTTGAEVLTRFSQELTVKA